MILAELPPGAEARPGVVYLVGAGPGDPGLVTVRALELLATADVVLHDELVPASLLERVRPDAELRWVGKRGHRPDQKQSKQHEIDAQLVALARAGKAVVRLKGGDPFLFGRGSEEAETLAREGIGFEVVPGVTSPLAAAAYAGISLTHRELASSVTFLSATTRDGSRYDARRLAGLRGGTLCILMGLHALEPFLRELVELAGLDPTTPVAVVSAGTRPRQRVIEGTLADVAARVAAAALPTPALAIVGDVASLRGQLRWFDRWPLFGKRVLVTRAEHQAPTTAALLARRGAEPIVVPTIRLDAAPDPERVARAVAELGTYDLVAFTSENGVRRFVDAMRAAGRDARAFGRARIAAIGDGTARALAAIGVVADVVPASFVGEALADAILADLGRLGGATGDATVAGRRVLLPRALVARETVPERLRAAGVAVDVVPVYVTRPPGDEARAALRSRFEDGGIDVVLLTSSSTADNLCDLLGEDAAALLAPCTVASIGPITTRTAERRGLRVDVTAEESTVPSLVRAIETTLRHVSLST